MMKEAGRQGGREEGREEGGGDWSVFSEFIMEQISGN
jgi:hypothetical protein